MDKTNSLICLAKEDAEKIFIKKIIDKMQRTSDNYYIQLTNFLDPGQIYLVECITNTLKIVNVYFDGGYIDAEKKRGILIPKDYYTNAYDSQVSVLKIIPSKFSRELNHRDYMGALLGLGIKTETLGDILVSEENCAYVVITDEIKDFIFSELKKVSKEQVKVKEVDKEVLSNIKIKDKSKEKNITVSALRVDSIISSVFNISRSTATSLVKQKRVRANFRLEETPHVKIENNTLISVQGYGRFDVLEVLGKTKKGRNLLKVKLY